MKIVILILLLYIGSISCQDSTAASTVVDVADAGPSVAPGPSSDPLKNRGACSYIYNGARYYQVAAQATLLGSNGNIFVNDALIRLLRSQMNLAPCQLDLSEGTPCVTNALKQPLPCADPVFDCGNDLIISKDVFSAVISGECNSNNATNATNNTLICQTIASNPSITDAVNSGACNPSCIQGAATTQSINNNNNGACLSYDITINAPTEDAAQALAVTLSSNNLQYSVIAGLNGFAASSNSGDSSAPAPAPSSTTQSSLQFLVASMDVRSAVGFGYFPPPPPPPPPLKPLAPANATNPVESVISTNATAAALASAGVLTYGPWSPCVPACGDGFSTRTVSCFSPDGTLMPLQACPGGNTAQTYQSCSNQCNTNQPYWTYSAWTPCSAPCGGGTSTRQAICQSSDGTPCDPKNQEPTTITCNTASCKSYSWKVSPWGECSASCGKGTHNRTVQCIDGNNQQVNATLCTSRKPVAVEYCNIQPCEFCSNNPCLGRGGCSNSVCECQHGYSGPYCEIARSCKSGIVDANLACCPSGLVNIRGECCAQGDRLDADGECCSQSIDVCGVCGGTGLFIDMQGTCCTVADANGVCCRSGNVDECGVCNGLGNTCNVKLTTKIQVPASLVMGGSVQEGPLNDYFQALATSMGLQNGTVSIGNVSLASENYVVGSGRRRLAQQGDYYTSTSDEAASAPAPSSSSSDTTTTTTTTTTIPLDVSIVISPPTDPNTTQVPFNSAYLAAQMQAAAATTPSTDNSAISLDGSPEPGRAAICGNGICEIGERSTVGAQDGSCPQDCGLPAIACLGGCGIGGNCLPASGVCQCYAGYLRPNCDDCAQGFIKSGGVCVSSVTSLGLINASVLTSAGEATVSGEDASSSEGSGLSVGAIVGIVIGALAGAVLAVVIAVMIYRRCCLNSGNSGDGNNGMVTSKDNNNYMFSNPAYAVADINVYANGGGGGSSVDGERMGGGDEELGLRHKYGVTGPAVGPGGPNSARLFDGNGGNYSSRAYSARMNTSVDTNNNNQELGLRQKYGASGPAVGPGGPNSARLFVEQLHSARSDASQGSASRASHRRSTTTSLVTASSSGGWHSAREANDTNSLTSTDLYKSKLFFNPAYSVDDAVDDRRAKLQALRDAVRALEDQAVRATATATREGEEEKVFLPGRPSVPRLALGKSNSGNQGGGGGAFTIKAVHQGDGGGENGKPRNPMAYSQVMKTVDDALM